MLSVTREADAAEQLFRKVLDVGHTTLPRVITVDKNAACPPAEVLLFHPCDRDNTHGRPRHGFTDGFSIADLVLRRLHRRFDIWWGDQPHLVTMLAKAPSPVVGTPTRFHPDAERGQMGDKRQ
jgi:hypothetical protein